MGLAWGSVTPFSTKDGIVIEPEAPNPKAIQSCQIQLKLLFPIQILTTSRHWSKTSTSSLNSPRGRELQSGIISILTTPHSMAIDELPNNFMEKGGKPAQHHVTHPQFSELIQRDTLVNGIKSHQQVKKCKARRIISIFLLPQSQKHDQCGFHPLPWSEF